jgi:predicted transcriptional regulator of viral defense system
MDDKIVKTLSERETRLLTTLSAAGKQIFVTQDARDILGSSINVNQVLVRLRHKRWLKRLSKGLYLILPFEAGMDGEFTVSSFLIATYLAEPSVIAYWSALNHHGFTEQISHTTFVATTQKKKEVVIEDLGLHFKFITLPPAKMFGQETLWIEGQAVSITDPAKTIVDCLDHPELCGGIVEAAKGLWYALTDRDIQPTQLTDYATRLGNRAVFKRMGYLVECMELPLTREILDDWQTRISAGYVLLEPAMGRKGVRNSRWRLWTNVRVADLTEWRWT